MKGLRIMDFKVQAQVLFIIFFIKGITLFKYKICNLSLTSLLPNLLR